MIPRLAVVGAFRFPVPQGSQVYAGEQCRALAASGAEVRLLCYGRTGRPAGGGELADLAVVRTPALLSPRRTRAGFSAAKPMADLALAWLLARECRRWRPEAVLAHNAEAAAAALLARPATGAPVVYVAHTLWREELPAHVGGRGWLAPVGGALDAGLARRCEAVIAVSRAAAEALERHARGPVRVIPPGLAPAPAPPAETVVAACRRHGLEPGGFVLYAGNLDAYQDLALLAEAAARHPEIPVVAATHDPRGAERLGALRVLCSPVAEIRALTHGARVCVLPRRARGGFPVKLLNYMEAARPIVAFAPVADGFRHGESAWLLDARADAPALGQALARVFAQPDLAATLGAGGRALLLRRHAPDRLAREILALVASLG